MKKWGLFTFVVLVSLAMLVGCGKGQYKDGMYRAEFSDYDNWGYKDYLEITVENGVVSNIVFDGIDSEGNSKILTKEYEEEMSAVQGTYPAQYTADLINQYMAEQDLDKVVAVAGASTSSAHFKILFTELEKPLYDGDTTPIVIQNPAL